MIMIPPSPSFEGDGFLKNELFCGIFHKKDRKNNRCKNPTFFHKKLLTFLFPWVIMQKLSANVLL